MSQFRRVACPLLLLLLPVILGGLTTSSCKAGIRVVVEPDPRVFTAFAGLLAGGYGGLDLATLNPTQQSILDALVDLDPAQRESWKGLLVGREAGSPPPEFALTDQVLQGGPPPAFAGLEADPGSSSLQRSLQCLWASQAQTLYDKMLEAPTTVGAPLASTAQDTVKQALAYARIGKSPFDSLQVIPNPLACQGFSRSWLDPETRTAYVVLGAEDGDLTLALARETFRIILDESLLRRLETAGRLESLSGVFEWSRAWPFGQDRCGTLADFARENLARACALRAFPQSPEDTSADLAGDWDSGFTLVQGLYLSLSRDFETGDQSLLQCAGGLLSALSTGDIANRMIAQPPAPVLPADYPALPLPEGWQWVRITYKGEDKIESWWAATGVIPAGKVYAPFAGTSGVGHSAGLVTSYRPSERTEIYEGDCISISGLERGLLVEGLPRESIPIKDGDRVAVQSGQVLVTLESPARVLVWFRKGESRDYGSLVAVPLDVLTALLNGR